MDEGAVGIGVVVVALVAEAEEPETDLVEVDVGVGPLERVGSEGLTAARRVGATSGLFALATAAEGRSCRETGLNALDAGAES